MKAFEPECGVKCHSRKHALEFNAAVSKSNLQEIQAYSRLCHNAAQHSDVWGRTALHVAAACGKCDILEWLLEEKNGEVSKKDTESGWTALHRAVFYGQLAAARLLIQYNSDLYVRDHEGLGPLDIAMKDRPHHYKLNREGQCEVFTWGDNSNFTLGQMIEHRRLAPEPVEELTKQDVCIKQVVMCKYHTVFLSRSGQVFTCGHGQGGRLGHGKEATWLVPKQVEALKDETCVIVAASRDHTAVVTKSGSVYTWGQNDNNQLGHSPNLEKCLTPKIVNLKQWKGRSVLGVCTGRFHTVLHTADAVLTFGLNAGQMGQPKMKGQEKVTQPKPVTYLNQKGLTISLVSCSDAATVVLTTAGDIFVLHEYQCRKIASRQQEIISIQVSGGHLDHSDSQILREKGGTELMISFLAASKKVSIWRSTRPTLKRAHWQIKRQLTVEDFVLTETSMAFVTSDGEGFIGTFSNKNTQTKDIQQTVKDKEVRFGERTLLDLLVTDEVEEIQVRRIPNVHRGTYITADKKGRNYAVVQTMAAENVLNVPAVSDSAMSDCFSRLLDEADEYDLIHDVILQVNGQTWPAHKFILINRCSNFFNVLSQCDQSDVGPGCPVVTVTGIHPLIFEQLMEYMYTDSCDLLTVGAKFEMSELSVLAKEEDIFSVKLEESDPDVELGKMSAFAVHQQHKKKSEKMNNKDKPGTRDPVKLLQDAAKRFGVEGLYKRLENVKYHKGIIVSSGKNYTHRKKMKFDKDRYRDSKWSLYDVCIKSDDGIEIECHKCILVARLEYFHSMLSSGWLETSASTALTLPIPGDILHILIDFLYTDSPHFIHNCRSVELLCNVLVVADQMLVNRLKEICEVALYPFVTHKNVGDLLEFSTMYNAGQLKCYCQQFIALNLTCILEARCLDVLSDDVIQDLIQYYRDSIPNMSCRMITPMDEGPSKAFLESLVSETTPSQTAKKSRTNKKRHRTKSVNEDGEKLSRRDNRRSSERQLSISSDISVKSDEDLMDTLECVEVKVEPQGNKETSKTSPRPTKHDRANSSPKQKPNTVISTQKHDSAQKVITKPQSPGTALGQGVWVKQGTWNQGSGDQGPPMDRTSLSLRDIMDQEKSYSASYKTSGYKKRFSWKDVKKQQLAENQARTSHIVHPEDSQQPVTTPPEPSKPVCPWGGVTQVVQSFRSLMVAEEAKSPPAPTLKSPKSALKSPSSVLKSPDLLIKSPTTPIAKQAASSSIVSWGLPGGHTKRKSVTLTIDQDTKPAQNASAGSPRSPENPWQIDLAQSPPSASFSFSDILKDELEKTDVLLKTSKKPLALIQLEEQAIEELLQYYKAGDHVDEVITVERVPQLSATPVWRRERIQST